VLAVPSSCTVAFSSTFCALPARALGLALLDAAVMVTVDGTLLPPALLTTKDAV
jgi:hypothetical protein